MDRRTAVVTGAARGIGAAVARQLASDGYAVAALDVRPCDETVDDIVAAGGVAATWRCDIRSWDEVHRVMADVEDRLGGIAALAAVAGVWQPKRFRDMDLSDWRRVLDVNLDGTFAACRAASEVMIAHGGGAIVVISSNAAQLAFDGGVHYSASKAALLGMVTAMAFELGPYGVRVNAIRPGTIETPASEAELTDPAIRASQESATTLGRLGRPSDIAQAVSFLLDQERAGWITGESLLVDGGYGSHGEGARDFSLTDTTAGD